MSFFNPFFFFFLLLEISLSLASVELELELATAPPLEEPACWISLICVGGGAGTSFAIALGLSDGFNSFGSGFNSFASGAAAGLSSLGSAAVALFGRAKGSAFATGAGASERGAGSFAPRGPFALTISLLRPFSPAGRPIACRMV